MRQGLRQALNLWLVPPLCIRRCEQHMQISGQNREAGMLPAAEPTARVATAAFAAVTFSAAATTTTAASALSATPTATATVA